MSHPSPSGTGEKRNKGRKSWKRRKSETWIFILCCLYRWYYENLVFNYVFSSKVHGWIWALCEDDLARKKYVIMISWSWYIYDYRYQYSGILAKLCLLMRLYNMSLKNNKNFFFYFILLLYLNIYDLVQEMPCFCKKIN